MKTPKFVTLYYKGIQNAYMVKDIGQLPYAMHKYYGYEAVLAGHPMDKAYPLLESETPGLRLDFIPKGKKIWRMIQPPIVRYLIKNAKEIDVLNLYFAKSESLFYGLLYKWLNPKGCLYIKMDANLDMIRSAGSFYYPTRNAVRKLFNALFVPLFFKKVDLFSIEQKEGMALAEKFHPKHAHKFIYLPNAVSEVFLERSLHSRGFDEKENLILFVGRVGLYEKNNEMLLKALESVDLKGWNVVFVGPIFESFFPEIESFYQKNPAKKEQVFFVGPEYERDKLAEWFDRAKVFCLTSRRESFGIVLIEAMLYNNYIVTTDIASAEDVTDSGRLGSVIKRDDVGALSKRLQGIVDEPEQFKEGFGEAREHILKNFTWAPLAQTLNQAITERMPERDS